MAHLGHRAKLLGERERVQSGSLSSPVYSAVIFEVGASQSNLKSDTRVTKKKNQLLGLTLQPTHAPNMANNYIKPEFF